VRFVLFFSPVAPMGVAQHADHWSRPGRRPARYAEHVDRRDTPLGHQTRAWYNRGTNRGMMRIIYNTYAHPCLCGAVRSIQYPDAAALHHDAVCVTFPFAGFYAIPIHLNSKFGAQRATLIYDISVNYHAITRPFLVQNSIR
jgi:hypothetical protein